MIYYENYTFKNYFTIINNKAINFKSHKIKLKINKRN